jgi:hypothetical protein
MFIFSTRNEWNDNLFLRGYDECTTHPKGQKEKGAMEDYGGCTFLVSGEGYGSKLS